MSSSDITQRSGLVTWPVNVPCDQCGATGKVRHIPDPECGGVHAWNACRACAPSAFGGDEEQETREERALRLLRAIVDLEPRFRSAHIEWRKTGSVASTDVMNKWMSLIEEARRG